MYLVLLIYSRSNEKFYLHAILFNTRRSLGTSIHIQNIQLQVSQRVSQTFTRERIYIRCNYFKKKISQADIIQGIRIIYFKKFLLS